MTTVGLMRVKNEARWIRESVASLVARCDHVLILDDHSSDGTYEILNEEFQKTSTVILSPFERLDEAADKTYLFAAAKSLWNPDWCIMIDGDEVITHDSLMPLGIAGQSCFRFTIDYLWDRADQIRVDGIYGRFTRPSMWRCAESDGVFSGTGNGGNFHCSNVPTDMMRRGLPCGVRLKHYGYMKQADRLRKYRWYNQIDPNNPNEDCYRHMVAGDVSEVPATAKTLHAGPLRLERYKY